MPLSMRKRHFFGWRSLRVGGFFWGSFGWL